MSKNEIKNAHCTYFEGQTGLCKAKEFVKCNPVNCKLYTIDELSTILDLQEQLKNKEQECEKLKTQYNCYACETCKGKEDYRNMKRHCENAIKANHRYKQALDEIEGVADSNLCDDDRDVCPDDCLCDWKVVKDIINKAKEQK